MQTASSVCTAIEAQTIKLPMLYYPVQNYSIRVKSNTLVPASLGKETGQQKSEKRMTATQTKTLDELEKDQPARKEKTTEATLENIDTKLKETSGYRKIEAGETATFLFDPKAGINIVEGEYEGTPTVRLHFTVVEPSVSTEQKKILPFSRKHSQQLLVLLKKGYSKIEVTRKGSGKNDTAYTFTPVPTT